MTPERTLVCHLSMILRGWCVYMNERLHPLGLTYGQFPFLLHLGHTPGVTQETLARHFRIDKGAVARAARRLEEDGFIRREVDPTDRRAVRLSLTEQGEAVLPEIRRLQREWEAVACAGLGPEGEQALCALLAQVAGNIAGEGCRHE